MTPPPTVAAPPIIPAKPRPKPDEKPFDPVGIAVGDLRLTPAIEEDVGYASNPLLLPSPVKGSGYETTQARLGVQSDWARNELRGTFTGGYADYFHTPAAKRPKRQRHVDGAARRFARYGARRGGALHAGPPDLRLGHAADRRHSVIQPTRPFVETMGATLGGTQKFGDLSLRRCTARSIALPPAEREALADELEVDNLASDDYNDWGLRAARPIQISPVVAPFVETIIDTRRYESTFDASGFERSSDSALARRRQSC